jgi:hypothetical protein
MADQAEIERARINAETARIGWAELQRFFAGGYAVAVDGRLDLVEVAYQMSRDNAEQLSQWLDAGLIGPVKDDQARDWLHSDAVVWSVVVRPWVLVQPASGDAASESGSESSRYEGRR